MVLKDTMAELKEFLGAMSRDLEKAFKGNKAAAQRLRTGSIEFAKLSKVFRKESMVAERGGKRVAKRSFKKKRE